MNMDSDSAGGMKDPVAKMTGVETPKSRKKLWIFGGLGCLGVIGIGCIGIVSLIMIYVYRPMQEFQNENVEMATSSMEVEAILGSPVTAGPTAPENAGAQKFIFRSTLTGPEGEGQLVFEAKVVGTEWIRESIYLEKDGEKTDLDPEAMFDIKIDDGQ
jgi:hypothetical protein